MKTTKNSKTPNKWIEEIVFIGHVGLFDWLRLSVVKISQNCILHGVDNDLRPRRSEQMIDTPFPYQIISIKRKIDLWRIEYSCFLSPIDVWSAIFESLSEMKLIRPINYLIVFCVLSDSKLRWNTCSIEIESKNRSWMWCVPNQGLG